MTISFIEFLNNLIAMPNFLIITILISGVMFANGCTDVPNGIATCVSSRALSAKKALLIAIFFNFLGVLIMTLVSSKVAETVFNIVNFGNDISNNMIALVSALIGIIMWSFFSWAFGIPSSQSHALLACLSGAGIAIQGDLSGINLDEWKKVLFGLIIINLLAFVLGYIITKLIEKICKNMDRRKTTKFFNKTQIAGAAATSFMNGAQDGQKFMAIFLLGLALSNGVTQINNFEIPLWLIIYCSVIIAIGAITGGIRIIKNIGTKIVKVESYQGTSADISSSICLFISSVLGIPVSSTHTKNSAVMGVGASKRISNVNWTVAKNMIFTWLITFPGCGMLGFILTKILTKIF
ncbi:MAG: inorganic phosphate transporter [Clostridia bacterium]|nr:inorganic phosphate transporter [Clostridia bacterium]